jgi:hypothetical protein
MKSRDMEINNSNDLRSVTRMVITYLPSFPVLALLRVLCVLRGSCLGNQRIEELGMEGQPEQRLSESAGGNLG